MGIRPRIGIRVKLSTRGAGKWEASGGDREQVRLSAQRAGASRWSSCARRASSTASSCSTSTSASQVSNIRNVKNALREASRFYVEVVAGRARR